MTGVAPGDLDQAPVRRVLGPSLLFIASFPTVFILLGDYATGVGGWLARQRVRLERAAAALIVTMGAFFIATVFIAHLNREWGIEALKRRAGRGGSRVAGGYLRSGVDTVRRPDARCDPQRRCSVRGGRAGSASTWPLLDGLAIPFLATALTFGRMTTAFAWVKRHYRGVMAAGGPVLVAIGVLVFTGELFQLSIEAQGPLDHLGNQLAPV